MSTDCTAVALIITIVLIIAYPQHWAYIVLILIALGLHALYEHKNRGWVPESFLSGHPSDPNVDEGAITSGYGYLSDDIGYGNPQSWSHIDLVSENVTLKGERAPVISQGTPFPLPYEERATAPVDNSMFYFSDYASRPECCQGGVGNYSSSTGCVCISQPTDPYNRVRQPNRIKPQT